MSLKCLQNYFHRTLEIPSHDWKTSALLDQLPEVKESKDFLGNNTIKEYKVFLGLCKR